MPPLTVESFPGVFETQRGRWAPIYLSPILGSPERLIIAVVAVNDTGFHIEAANSLKKLECLYGRAAETAIFASEVALNELRSLLSDRGKEALTEGALVFSGVNVGAVSDGEARSLPDLARTWMAALSSLYRYEAAELVQRAPIEQIDDGVGPQDRLPLLVLDHVNSIRPALGNYFSEEIRLQLRRRPKSKIAGVSIDFSGPKLVANFATLQANTQATAVDRIKRKMFDLKVRRDEDGRLLPQRLHEMIVFTPPRESLSLNERQLERLDDALYELTFQSSREGFNFRAMHGVPDIGARLLLLESPGPGN